MELETLCAWKKLVSRKSPMLWRNLEMKGYTREILVKYTGIDAFIAWKADGYALFCNPEHFVSASSKLKSIVTENSGIFDDIAARCYALCKDYLDFCVSYRYASFENHSDDEMKAIFTEYVNKNIAIVAFRPAVLMLDNLIAAFINDEVAKFENVDFRYELIIPKKDLPFMARQKDILNIGSELEKLGLSDTSALPVDVEKLISDHLERFGWVLTHRYLGEPMTNEDVLANLDQYLGSCSEKLAMIKQESEMKTEALNKIKSLSVRLGHLIDTSQEYAYLRTFRMDAAIEGDFYLRPFFYEIARRVGLEYNKLIYLTTDEIVALLAKEKTCSLMRDIVGKRHVYFATFLVNDNEICNFEGDEYKEYLKQTVFPDQSIINGKVAQRGRITGKVKVVRFKEEIGKVNEGDIIVSPMTTPEMIGGLMKCAGIITDEGGIASHAAQISREFKIPCIIGTNNASYILKDGDIVEIVADGLEGSVVRKQS
jgi:phosphohistidine swiveling domain-containing protein